MKNSGKFIQNVLEGFAVYAVGFWAIHLLFTTALFILKLPISKLNLFESFPWSVIFLFWYSHAKFKNFILVSLTSLVIFFATFLPLTVFAGKIYDLSYDGQAYHQEAVIQFSRGWNPVYMILDGEATANLERWLNHYPKAVWIADASINNLTGNIESGKVLSLYCGIVAFAFCLWAVWKISIPWPVKFLGSLILALNPVVVYQSLSYYLDGILVSLLLVLASICFKIYQNKKDKTLFYPYLFVFIIASNVKLTGVVFASILTFGFIIYFWFVGRLRLSLTLFKYLLAGLIIGIGFVGYNPYVTNFASRGHPLYPAAGKDALDYVLTNTPQNYWKIPSPLRLVSSIFAPSSLARGEGQKTYFKIPFTFSKNELETFRETNAKTGGFGPIFGGIFALSFIVFLFGIIFSQKPNKFKFGIILAILVILGSASLVATSSVARFVPYVWWIPGLIIFFLASEKKLVSTILSITLLILLFLNIGIIAGAYIPYNIAQSRKLGDQLVELARNQQDKPVYISVFQFGSTKIKLKTQKIAYVEIFSETGCKKTRRFLVNNISKLCEF